LVTFIINPQPSSSFNTSDRQCYLQTQNGTSTYHVSRSPHHSNINGPKPVVGKALLKAIRNKLQLTFNYAP